MSDLISRAAAIDAICEDGTQLERQGQYSMTMAERKQRDADILDALPSAQPQDIARDISRIIENEKDMRVIAKNAQPDYQEVLGWLLAYHTKSFDLHGRYMPHEVIGWLVHDFANAYMAERREEE